MQPCYVILVVHLQFLCVIILRSEKLERAERELATERAQRIFCEQELALARGSTVYKDRTSVCDSLSVLVGA